MAKPAKPIPAASDVATKPKNSKRMIIIIVVAVLVLLIAGGAAWYSAKSSSHTEAAKPHPAPTPKFIKLETFTVNLRHGEGEEGRILQTVINLEVHDAELEEKIKLLMPKIYNNILILLSKKWVPELSTVEGKQQLTREIKAEIEIVLGLRAAPASIPTPAMHENAPGAETASQVAPAEPASAPAFTAAHDGDSGIVDVLFTSFIIQ